MYDLSTIQDAIASHMPRLVEAIQTAENAQSMTAYMQIDMAAAVEAFCEAIIDDADFNQSIEDDFDKSEDAEWYARRDMSRDLTAWRIKNYGKTWREIKYEKEAIAKEIIAEREASL